MFEVGQKARVKENVTVASQGIGGHIVTIRATEPVMRDRNVLDGAVAYRVMFDDPADKGQLFWLADTWLNDYELEAIDG